MFKKNNSYGEKIYNRNFIVTFIIILIIKIIIMGLFSSDYQNKLFIPFENLFINNIHNPWQYVYENNIPSEFPYHPVMLYIFSIGAFLIKVFSIHNVFLLNILFKFPTLLADLGIFYLLLKIFKNKSMSVLWIYFCSPVIIYAAYIHSQLDLVPAAFLFLAFYYLKKAKIYQASVIYALALSIKMNVILLLPVFLTYIYKCFKKINIFYSFIIIALIYFSISYSYIFSEGYQKMVLFNEKQNLLFNLILPLGNIKIYIPVALGILIYLRFFAYKKINTELLDLYSVLTISLFLLFIPPSTPAWFIWLIPFLSLFVIKYSNKNKNILLTYYLFNTAYLIYFIFFHVGDYNDITYLNTPINTKIQNEFIRNCIFTALDAILAGTIYYIYKLGIKSNLIYKKDKAIVIGIGGNSGSGKTTLLESIKTLLKDDLVMLEGDGDHKWERGNEHWVKYTHLDPKANFLHHQYNDILKLKKLESIYRKDYNHDSGKFEDAKKIEPKSFIIMSGLHTFYLPKMRRLIDFKIYLNPDEELRKYWKIKRDTKLRGYSKEEVLAQMNKRESDSEKYINSQKEFADLIISYFPVNKEDLNSDNIEHLGLKLELDSSIHTEDIVEDISNLNIPISWDYSDDLKTQYIITTDDLTSCNFNEIISQKIENIDEILPKNTVLKNGQEGFIQLIVLKILSEKMKDSYDKRYFD